MADRIGNGNYEHRVDIDPRAAWELESLAPDQIAEIVEEAIEADWDEDAYNDVIDEEKRGRNILAQRLARVNKIMVRGDD